MALKQTPSLPFSKEFRCQVEKGPLRRESSSDPPPLGSFGMVLVDRAYVGFLFFVLFVPSRPIY
jgi:hypothetical protein